MLQHIKHLLSSGRYNRRGLIDMRRAPLLLRSWYRNEVAFLRRSSRLAYVLGVDGPALNELLRESAEVMDHCAERSREFSALLPGLLNPNFGPVLYAVVRVLRPGVIVETGVGSGVSSTFLLEAMERNDAGKLYSIDLPLPEKRLLPEGLDTGWMVPDRLRARWRLTLGDARDELPPLLDNLGQLDLFFHDSDHSYRHMTWEFNSAYPRIRPGGVLLSDDITSNRAWDDFVSIQKGPSARISRTGVHRKPAD